MHTVMFEILAAGAISQNAMYWNHHMYKLEDRPTAIEYSLMPLYYI